MNDNLKSCSDCRHLRVSRILNYQHEFCTKKEFQSWDCVRGFGDLPARQVREDNMMCGINAYGFEKKLKLHERLSELQNGMVFCVSVLIAGLGLALAIEGLWVVGGLLVGVFGYGIFWSYKGLPDN